MDRKVEIGVYRGWEIFFDTELEVFYVFSDSYDNENRCKSFASAKKYIDDYIKENTDFKPFFVENDGNIWSKKDVRKIIGLRKDGQFTYEDSKGKKQAFSKYDLERYYLTNPDNDPIFKQIGDCDERIAVITKEKQALEAKVIKKTLKQIQKEREA